jgi:hypothetical protein
MLPIFLLILVLIFGLNVLTWFTNYSPTLNGPTAPAFPPITKQENFACNTKNQVDEDYRLLADVLPLEDSKAVARTDITSEACRLKDAALDLQLNGDYSQRTNNYLRKFPDSCSAPRHEMLLDFYATSEKKPIQAGTLC